MAEEVLLIASSSVDAGVGCWDLQTGGERVRYKSCASPSHGLICVGQNVIASSQARELHVPSGSILYWSWPKAQIEVKSFPEEPIKPILANGEGTYLFGGGVSGHIYLWEVATGILLRKWRGHYRAVSCLIFNEDESLLISGSDDGAIKVWPLFVIFDDEAIDQISYLHMHNFSEHMEGINDIAVGCGGSNSVIVSSSKDRTCKVWSLSRGTMLRSISYPSEINAVALDPGEHVFYAGGADGNIYITALHADFSSTKNQWLYIIGSLSCHSQINCLDYAFRENLLLAGSADGSIRAWDPTKRCVVRVFKLSKGPVSNVRIFPKSASTSAPSTRRNSPSQLPPLAKYTTPTSESANNVALVLLKDSSRIPIDDVSISARVVEDQIKEIQHNGSSPYGLAAETMKAESSNSAKMLKKWIKMFNHLHEFCVDEILDGFRQSP